MASFYIALLEYEGGVVPTAKFEATLNKFKDWLTFSPAAAVIYTEWKASQVRDYLREELGGDPGIIVIPTALSGWAAYAKTTEREWLKRDRNPDEMDGV